MGVLVPAGAALLWGPRVRARVAMLYWQRQCLQYIAPADQIVYEDKPIPGGPFPVAPAPVGALRITRPPPAMFIAPCWSKFAPSTSSNAGSSRTGATLFLHERQTKAGMRRLVVITRGSFASSGRPSFDVLNIGSFLVTPGDYRSSPVLNPCLRIMLLTGPIADEPRTVVRYYAGQADPADPAHFTIRYAVDGVPGKLDGRLSDDAKDVTITARDGPAFQPERNNLMIQSR